VLLDIPGIRIQSFVDFGAVELKFVKRLNPPVHYPVNERIEVLEIHCLNGISGTCQVSEWHYEAL